MKSIELTEADRDGMIDDMIAHIRDTWSLEDLLDYVCSDVRRDCENMTDLELIDQARVWLDS